MNKSLEKDLPWRSEKYLAHVRTLDCVDCGHPATLGNNVKGYIEAHHIRTNAMSSRCGDDETVPLCGPYGRKCHQKADKSPDSAERYAPIAKRIFEEWQARQ